MSLDTSLVRWILCRYTCLGTEISERTAVRVRRVNSDKHTNIIVKYAHKCIPTPIFVSNIQCSVVTCAKDNVSVMMMMVMTVRSLMWKWRHLLSGEPLINTDAQFVIRILGNPRV